MTSRDCPTCSRPLPDQGTICHGCTNRLRKQLTEIPWLADQLEVTLIRDDNLTGHSGGRSATTALPFNEAASGALTHLRETVTSWCRLAADDAGARPGDDSITAMCHAIRDVLPDLRMHPAAGDLAWEISDAHARALAVIDRPEDRACFEVGPCPQQWGDVACEGTVVAHFPTDGRPYLACGACQSIWREHEWVRAGQAIGSRTAYLRLVDELRRVS